MDFLANALNTLSGVDSLAFFLKFFEMFSLRPLANIAAPLPSKVFPYAYLALGLILCAKPDTSKVVLGVVSAIFGGIVGLWCFYSAPLPHKVIVAALAGAAAGCFCVFTWPLMTLVLSSLVVAGMFGGKLSVFAVAVILFLLMLRLGGPFPRILLTLVYGAYLLAASIQSIVLRVGNTGVPRWLSYVLIALCFFPSLILSISTSKRGNGRIKRLSS